VENKVIFQTMVRLREDDFNNKVKEIKEKRKYCLHSLDQMN
jgi:hypothetical protein